jgi:hypothetical protein
MDGLAGLCDRYFNHDMNPGVVSVFDSVPRFDFSHVRSLIRPLGFYHLNLQSPAILHSSIHVIVYRLPRSDFPRPMCILLITIAIKIK